MLRLLAAALLCATLTACGFSPVYAPTDDAAPQSVFNDFATIQIDPISQRIGQILRNELIDRLNAKGRAEVQYRLSVALTEQQIALAIARDATLTRSQILEVATISLSDIKTNKIVLTRRLTASSTYSILPSQFGTLVTEQDARERSLRTLSEQITTALSIYFKNLQGK